MGRGKTLYKNCNGCSACVSICPKHCITMVRDKEGFLYPKINATDCIHCGLCDKICPLNKSIQSERNFEEVVAYAAKNKDERIRQESSSGGVFTEFAKYVIQKGGAVFGAAFAEDFKVQHCYVEDMDGLKRFRGSKYVQSEIGDTYQQAKAFLEQGRLVLFSGTPCQIGGLLVYLQKPYTNLVTQDLICHGVPSPMVWEIYKKSKEKRGQIQDISFRDKTEGWKAFSMCVSYVDGEVYREPLNKDIYMQAFLKNICLRQSCYQCQFKTKDRQSDITLADYWGIQRVHPEFDDDKGASLVFLNSKKGRQLFEEIKDNFHYIEADKDKAISFNSAMIKSVEKPKKREKFLRKVNCENFEKLVNQCVKPPLLKRAIWKMKSIARRIIKGEK